MIKFRVLSTLTILTIEHYFSENLTYKNRLLCPWRYQRLLIMASWDVERWNNSIYFKKNFSCFNYHNFRCFNNASFIYIHLFSRNVSWKNRDYYYSYTFVRVGKVIGYFKNERCLLNFVQLYANRGKLENWRDDQCNQINLIWWMTKLLMLVILSVMI